MNTVSVRTNGNTAYRDKHYSPVDSMWADCPKLAALQDPFMACWVKEDFTTYTAGDWTISETGAGGSTAQTDVAGGGIILTSDVLENDSQDVQKKGEAYQLTTGKPLWFEAMLQVSEATELDFIVGLIITDTTMIDAVSDGIYFLKDDGDANIDYHCEKDSNDTTADTLIDIVAATDTRFGLKFDGAGKVEYWIDGQRIVTSSVYVPNDELLCVSCGVQSGDGNSRTLTWKYYEVFQIQ